MVVNDIDLTLPDFLDRKNPEVRERLEKAAVNNMKLAQELSAEKAAKRAAAEKKLRAELAIEAKREAVLLQRTTEPSSKPVSKPVTAPKRKASGYNPSAVIRVISSENPHREGSQAVGKFDALRDGMTVADYLNVTLTGSEGKWQKGALSHYLGKGLIKLEG